VFIAVEGDWLAIALEITFCSLAVTEKVLTVHEAQLYQLSGGIVKLAYERGAFSPEDTLQVCRVQQFYLLQMPFYILGGLWGKVISAMHVNQILMWGAVMNVSVCVISNLVLDPRMGISGVALSNSIVYAVSTLYLWVVLRRAIPQVGRPAFAPGVSS